MRKAKIENRKQNFEIEIGKKNIRLMLKNRASGTRSLRRVSAHRRSNQCSSDESLVPLGEPVKRAYKCLYGWCHF